MNRSHFSTPARIGSVAGATIRFVLAVLVALASTGCHSPLSRSNKDSAQTVRSRKERTTRRPRRPSSMRRCRSEQEFNVHLELARVHESQGNNEAAVAEYQKAVDVCEH